MLIISFSIDSSFAIAFHLRRSKDVKFPISASKFHQLLQALQEQEAEEKTERQRARLEEIRDAVDAARAKQVADKEAEQELDLIYRDEAERVWRKRETEWAAEQAARANLMQLVLDERSQQVKQKLTDLELARRQNVEEREIALKEMEMLKLQSEAEMYEKEEEKVMRKEELKSAITARREAAISARLQMEEELKRQKDQEQMMKGKLYFVLILTLGTLSFNCLIVGFSGYLFSSSKSQVILSKIGDLEHVCKSLVRLKLIC